jgi:hypothetical protein
VVPQHFSQHRNRVVTVCAPVARFRLSLRMCYWHVRRRRALRHSTSRGDSFRTLTGLSVSLVSPSFVPSPSPCVASDARAVSGAVDDFLELRSRPWWVPHGHGLGLGHARSVHLGGLRPSSSVLPFGHIDWRFFFGTQ